MAKVEFRKAFWKKEHISRLEEKPPCPCCESGSPVGLCHKGEGRLCSLTRLACRLAGLSHQGRGVLGSRLRGNKPGLLLAQAATDYTAPFG